MLQRKAKTDPDKNNEDIYSIGVAVLFLCELDSSKYASGIDADMRAGQNAGVNATPTFFVNGHPLSGAASYERFKELVDAALEQAQPMQRTN